MFGQGQTYIYGHIFFRYTLSFVSLETEIHGTAFISIQWYIMIYYIYTLLLAHVHSLRSLISFLQYIVWDVFIEYQQIKGAAIRYTCPVKGCETFSDDIMLPRLTDMEHEVLKEQFILHETLMGGLSILYFIFYILYFIFYIFLTYFNLF